MVIHETLACQGVDEDGSSCRKHAVNLSPDQQTNVDHKQGFPIAYDVPYGKEEQTCLPQCEVVNSQLKKKRRGGMSVDL